MTLWPFRPSGVISGRLVFETAILGSHNSEQRIAGRPAPRLVLRFDTAIRSGDALLAREAAQEIALAAGRVDLPDWRYPVLASVLASASTVEVGSAAPLFQVGGDLVIWTAPRVWHRATITAVGATSVTYDPAPSQDFLAATVLPVRSALLDGGEIRASQSGNSYSTAGLQATITGYPSLEATVAIPAVFEGVEIWTGKKLRVAPGVDAVSRDLAVIDNRQGPQVGVPVRSYSSGLLSLATETSTAAEALALEAFLHRRRGRQKAFWIPTGVRDLELRADPDGSAQLLVGGDVAPANLLGRRFFFSSRAGARIAAVVSGAISSGSDVLATFDQSFPAGPSGEVVLSELARVRLEEDALEMQFQRGGGCRLVTNARRLDHEL